MKKTLVLDLDDTICPFVSRAHDIAHLVTGRRMNDQELSTRWLNEDVVYSAEQLKMIRAEIFTDHFYLSLLPCIPRTVLSDWLWRLQSEANYDIHVITARDGCVPGGNIITERWLSMWNIPCSRLDIIPPTERKSRYFEANADAIIEDNGKHAEDAADYGVHAVLIDKVWNQSIQQGPNIRRVSSLIEAFEHLLQRSQRS